MIKYFFKALKQVNKLLEYPKEDKCKKCEFTETCEIQRSDLCGYNKAEGEK